MYQNFLGSCQSILMLVLGPYKELSLFVSSVSETSFTEIHLAVPEHQSVLDMLLGSTVPEGVIAAVGHAATAWDGCPLSGLCCSVWPSAVVSPCPQQFLVCFPPGCHCHRYTVSSELPKLPSGTWKKWGNDPALFQYYTVKGVSKPQCLTEVLMKSMPLLISYIITCPFSSPFFSHPHYMAPRLQDSAWDCARAGCVKNTRIIFLHFLEEGFAA